MRLDPFSLLIIFLTLFVVQTLVDLLIERLNQKSIQQHMGEVPAEFRGHIDDREMTQIARYTLSKSRVGMIEEVLSESALLTMILSEALCRLETLLSDWGLHVIPAGIVFFVVPGAILQVIHLPFSYYRTFGLEEKFGFNRSTLQLWLIDHLKSALLSALLLSLVLSLILLVIDLSPHHWWIWGFLAVSLLQILLVEFYPVLIAPLFNKFEPIKDGELALKIRALMEKHGIIAKKILEMNAGLRSGHTNAYFTGLGKTKQIVLYDTMLKSHPHDEILSILAHEMGHLKGGHVLKGLILFEIGMLAGFYATHLVLDSQVLYTAFGFAAPRSYVGLFLLGIFWQKVGFFIQPLPMALSRHFERQADLFAVRFVNATGPMIGALRRLAVDNLSNLTPHPLYVRFHYSHPPLVERVKLLEQFRIEGGGSDIVYSS